MDLEVVFEELGQFGRYQTWQLILLSVPLLASSFEEISYMFTSSQIDHRCLVPECEKPDTTEFEPSWLQYAVPYEDDPPNPKWCDRYVVQNKSHAPNETCDENLFSQDKTERCHHWVFASQERTVATEFRLLCEGDVYKRTMVGTINNIGLITNYIIVCHLSDRFGRKLILLILTFVQGLLVLAQSFSRSYFVFITLEYFVCFASTFNSVYVLVMENVGGDRRIFANCLMNTLYCLGETVVALIMWWARDFRVLLRVLACIKLANLLYMWKASESLHWYMIREHYEKVVNAVNKMEICNNKKVSEPTRQGLNILLSREEKAEQSRVRKTGSVFQEMYRSPSLFWRFVICSLTWLVDVFVYFGFSLMTVSLAGNKFINFVMVSLIEVPAYLAMWLGMQYINIGRKTTLCASCFLAALPCAIFLFVSPDAVMTRLSLFLLGKFAITISYTVIYEVGAEVFPTELRQSMVGLCCAVACLGGLFAPQIPLLAMYMNPMILFFWLSVGAGCLSLMLPETRGQSLPDTILQANKLQ